jgi:arylsulfatase A-like enzyme
MTGLYPNRHKVRTFFHLLPHTIITLADILKNKGWKTSAWVEHLTFKMQKITKGITTVVESFGRKEANLFDFIDKISLEEHNFIIIHVFDVHKPYLYTTGGDERFQYNQKYVEKMKSFAEKIDCNGDILLQNAQAEAKRVTNYDDLSPSLQEYAVFRSLDYLLRTYLRDQDRLFEEIIPLYIQGVNKFDQGKFKDIINTLTEKGLLDNGLLIIASDHGETRCTWEGREDFMNSFNVREGAIHVPLIMYAEFLPSELEIPDDVGIIDVVPTVLDLLHIDGNLTFDGTSLVPLIESGTGLPPRTLFSESWAYQGSNTFFGAVEKVKTEFLAEASARKKGYKYVWKNPDLGPNMFYTYEDDPFEENPLPLNEFGSALQTELSAYLLQYHIEKIKEKITFKSKKVQGWSRE